jgi:hypothetical protein
VFYNVSPGSLFGYSPEPQPTPIERQERAPTPPGEEGSSPALPVPDPAIPEENPEETTPPPAASVPAEVAVQMDEIERQVTSIRGLELLEPVDRYLMTPEELREHVVNDFFADYSAEDARDDVIELAAFGLIDDDFDLYNFYLDIYSEQIAGFYDHDIKAMYVIQGGGFRGPQRLTYAHEFVHALQDQHYDLREGLNYSDEACEDDSERCAAIQALVEGDASFTETQWLFQHSTDQDRREILESYRESSSPIFDEAPPFVRESLLFPYLAGIEFVEYLYDQGGWEAVDAAYRNPPVSTSQILHPQLYPNKTPVVVELPDFSEELGEGWREISRNVVGEYYTYLILAHGIDPRGRLAEREAREAAAGWAGDAYAIYYNDETQATILVHRSLWDSSAEAEQYSAAFIKYGNARFGRGNSAQTGQTSWQSAQGVNLLQSSGDTTTWILAPDEETTALLLTIVERNP